MQISLNHLILDVKLDHYIRRKVFFMLGPWRQHNEYISFVLNALKELAASDPERLIEYQNVISKMLIQDLDPMKKSWPHCTQT